MNSISASAASKNSLNVSWSYTRGSTDTSNYTSVTRTFNGHDFVLRGDTHINDTNANSTSLSTGNLLPNSSYSFTAKVWTNMQATFAHADDWQDSETVTTSGTTSQNVPNKVFRMHPVIKDTPIGQSISWSLETYSLSSQTFPGSSTPLIMNIPDHFTPSWRNKTLLIHIYQQTSN